MDKLFTTKIKIKEQNKRSTCHCVEQNMQIWTSFWFGQRHISATCQRWKYLETDKSKWVCLLPTLQFTVNLQLYWEWVCTQDCTYYLTVYLDSKQPWKLLQSLCQNTNKKYWKCFTIQLSLKSSDYRARTASFSIIRHQLCVTGNKILQNKITGTQTSFFPWVSSPLSVLLSVSTAATYIFSLLLPVQLL
jgi:hypothetical protein